MTVTPISLPSRGVSREELLHQMRSMLPGDFDWKGGKTWSLVYYAGEEITALLEEAYRLFFHGNALNPMAFPSLRRFENEVVAMTASLLGGGGEAAGSMTSGGTESIILAVKTARDRARAERPQVTAPEMVLPVSAHPAFLKAAHYLDVTPVRIPLRPGFRADVEAARGAVTENTVLVVGSAPAYPHGAVDPIPELASLAAERGIPCHVDACLGGFMLPFLEKLGHPVPPFDFRVPGVTSISADLHKYGYAAKGASVILYRDRDLRRHQYFALTDWPGGLFGSPTVTGTRPGGSIAAAWAVLNFLGEEGYLRLAATAMNSASALMEGVDAVPGLHVLGKPDMTVFAFGSNDGGPDIFLLGDAMEEKGWHLDRQQLPSSLHLMVTAAHAGITGQFLADLGEAAEAVRSGAFTGGQGMAAIYGMAGTIPEGDAKNFILSCLDGLYST